MTRANSMSPRWNLSLSREYIKVSLLAGVERYSRHQKSYKPSSSACLTLAFSSEHHIQPPSAYTTPLYNPKYNTHLLLSPCLMPRKTVLQRHRLPLPCTTDCPTSAAPSPWAAVLTCCRFQWHNLQQFKLRQLHRSLWPAAVCSAACPRRSLVGLHHEVRHLLVGFLQLLLILSRVERTYIYLPIRNHPHTTIQSIQPFAYETAWASWFRHAIAGSSLLLFCSAHFFFILFFAFFVDWQVLYGNDGTGPYIGGFFDMETVISLLLGFFFFFFFFTFSTWFLFTSFLYLCY